MSKWRSILGRKTWIGLVAIFLTSLVVNALCSLLLVKGVLSETSAGTCVYAAWGIGGMMGSWIATSGQQGALFRGGLLTVAAFGLTWLFGYFIFGSVNFGGYGWGVAIALCVGCLLGSILGSGKKQKRRKKAGKKSAKKRH